MDAHIALGSNILRGVSKSACIIKPIQMFLYCEPAVCLSLLFLLSHTCSLSATELFVGAEGDL